jgi:integrase
LGWVNTNVAPLATLGRRKSQPRSALPGADVRAVIAAALHFDPAAGLALRLAAVTGARRAELCALRWSDLAGDRLTIDSSIEIVRRGSVTSKQSPTLVDAATKTPNQRVVRLDERTVVAFETLRAERERWVRGCCSRGSARSTRSGSRDGGDSPAVAQGSRHGGGCTTCGTGRPPKQSGAVTTFGLWPAVWDTPIRR